MAVCDVQTIGKLNWCGLITNHHVSIRQANQARSLLMWILHLLRGWVTSHAHSATRRQGCRDRPARQSVVSRGTEDLCSWPSSVRKCQVILTLTVTVRINTGLNGRYDGRYTGLNGVCMMSARRSSQTYVDR